MCYIQVWIRNWWKKCQVTSTSSCEWRALWPAGGVQSTSNLLNGRSRIPIYNSLNQFLSQHPVVFNATSALAVAGSPLHRPYVSIWCWSERTSCCPSHDSALRAHPSPLQCGVSSWYLHLPHPPQHGSLLYSLRGQVGWACPVWKASYIVVSK